GVARPVVRIGDSGLFAAVLDAVRLEPPWRRRLARAFGDPKRLRQVIAGNNATGRDASGLSGASPARVRRRVEEMFATAGLGGGGRTPAEIAARFAEKDAMAMGIDGRTREVLGGLLGIRGTPAASVEALRDLAGRERLDFGP